MLATSVNILHSQNLRFRCPPPIWSHPPILPLHTKQLAEARFSVLARGSFYVATARRWEPKNCKTAQIFYGCLLKAEGQRCIEMVITMYNVIMNEIFLKGSSPADLQVPPLLCLPGCHLPLPCHTDCPAGVNSFWNILNTFTFSTFTPIALASSLLS